MKGLVFTEFLEMIDERFSIETSERLLEMSQLPSGGIYTSVGTYDFQEMAELVGNLSRMTGIPAGDLLLQFGRHLFQRFLTLFPAFFEGLHSTCDFLPLIDSYVHMEVRKLYADAELPSFTCERPEPGRLIMTYRSTRNIPDLAEGLIRACIEHFQEPLDVARESLGGNPPAVRFTVFPRG